MRKMTAQHFAIEHARQHDVVGKLRLASALCARINLPKRLADNLQWFPVVVAVFVSHPKCNYRVNVVSLSGQEGGFTPAVFIFEHWAPWAGACPLPNLRVFRS